MATIIRMPEVLAGASEAAIQSWLVQPGQTIAVGVPLAEVETEKATVEYAAETEGTVLKLLVTEGVSVKVGEPIAVVGAEGEAVPDEPGALGAAANADATASAEATGAGSPVPGSPVPSAAGSADAEPPVAGSAVAGSAAAGAVAGSADPAPAGTAAAGAASSVASAGSPPAPQAAGATGAVPSTDSGDRLFASPLVRRLAKERGLDLATVRGSGPGGRIVRRDLDAASASGSAATTAPQSGATATPLSAQPAAPVAAGQPAEKVTVPLSRMRKAIARRLTESKSTVPHFYLVADCRVERLLTLRAEANATSPVKLSVNDFVLKAAAAAFIDVPEANATWGDDAITRYTTVDMSVAVAIDGGLVTPVLRSVERMSLTDIARSVADVAERARTGQLRQHELEGGSFAVSNLGMYGITEFSAIINPPQSAILAVGRATAQPVVVDDRIEVGQVMTVTLSADHRVLDGALAAQWLGAFVKHIENPLGMLV